MSDFLPLKIWEMMTRTELFCALLNSPNPISERGKLPTLSEFIHCKNSMLRSSDYRFLKSVEIP